MTCGAFVVIGVRDGTSHVLYGNFCRPKETCLPAAGASGVTRYCDNRRYNGAMEPSDYILIGAAVAILGFLLNLQRELGGLRERMAKLEGTVGLLAKAVLDRAGT